jgi:hypothetical protein
VGYVGLAELCARGGHRALERIAHAAAVLGSVELDSLVAVAPVWRPLIAALGQALELSWHNPGGTDIA